MSRTAQQDAWRAANREQERIYERERRRKLYRSNSVKRAEKNRALREWRAKRTVEDPTFRAKQTADNSRRHRERLKADAEYLERHRGHQIRNNAKRRGLEEAGESFTREEIYRRDKGVCHLCGKRAPRSDYVVDHVVPLALGGKHTRNNAAVAHPLCNARKSARPSHLF